MTDIVKDFWQSFDNADGELGREHEVERLPVFRKGEWTGMVSVSALTDYLEEYHDYLAGKHGFEPFLGSK